MKKGGRWKTKQCVVCRTETTLYYKQSDFCCYAICGTACMARFLNNLLGSEFNKGDAIMGYFLDGYIPETIQDTSNDFKPLDGAYKVSIESLKRKIGISKRTDKEYDFYSLRGQVTETLEGDKGTNRYLDKIYNADEIGLKKLADDLFTAGIAFESSSEEAFDLSLENVKDQIINIRAWVRPAMTKNAEDEWIEKEPREDKQYLKIVADFSLKNPGLPVVNAIKKTDLHSGPEGNA